jgi:hypothetical protein
MTFFLNWFWVKRKAPVSAGVFLFITVSSVAGWQKLYATWMLLILLGIDGSLA